MPPDNPLRPWSHSESWAVGFSITGPRPTGPPGAAIRAQNPQRARASTTIPAAVRTATRIDEVELASNEQVISDELNQEVPREQQGPAEHRRHTASSIGS